MKTLVICLSPHHQNTQKVAEAISCAAEGRLITPDEFQFDMLGEYSLIGFGSGIYFGSHHKKIIALAKSLPEVSGKRAFLFSTAGIQSLAFHNKLKKILSGKKFLISGEFQCKGFDTFGPLVFWGGINRGRPDTGDLKRASDFTRALLAQDRA